MWNRKKKNNKTESPAIAHPESKASDFEVTKFSLNDLKRLKGGASTLEQKLSESTQATPLLQRSPKK